MRRPGTASGIALGLIALGALAPMPAGAAGFSIFEQGAKGMGMAGAFTAQADDGSAMFHNAAGLAFQHERKLQAGFTWIKATQAEFRGENPFPGENARGEQELLSEFPPHAYWVQPINPNMTFGFGVYSPFGLVTEWKNPNTFSGRFLSAKAALRTFDLNPTIAFKFGNFGLGVGAIARVSDVELQRNAGTINPFTAAAVDVAHIKLTSDFEKGYGWNFGVLHKLNETFSWGLSYRSKVTIDYAGEAQFTQISTGNAGLDAAIARSLPVGQTVPVETSIEFPDVASLGLAFTVTPSLLIETDVNWTGWSTFDALPLTFPDQAALSGTIAEEWQDCYNYRLGVRYTMSPVSQLRFGYVYDETPQPDESVSPLLPDANRNGITLGWGHEGRFSTDVSLMYLPIDTRSTHTNRDRFNGTYNTTAWLLGVTVGF